MSTSKRKLKCIDCSHRDYLGNRYKWYKCGILGPTLKEDRHIEIINQGRYDLRILFLDNQHFTDIFTAIFEKMIEEERIILIKGPGSKTFWNLKAIKS